MTNKEVKPFMSDMLWTITAGTRGTGCASRSTVPWTLLSLTITTHIVWYSGPDFFITTHHAMEGRQPLHTYGNLIHKKESMLFHYGFKYALPVTSGTVILFWLPCWLQLPSFSGRSHHPYIFINRHLWQYHFQVIYSYSHQTLSSPGCCTLPVWIPEAWLLLSLEKLLHQSKNPQRTGTVFTFIMKYIGWNHATGSGRTAGAKTEPTQLARLFSDPNNGKAFPSAYWKADPGRNAAGDPRFLSAVRMNTWLLNVPEEPWQHPCTGKPVRIVIHSFSNRPSATPCIKSAWWITVTMMVTVSEVHEMYFGNKCYDRYPCGSDLEMTYFDIIFEKHPQL